MLGPWLRLRWTLSRRESKVETTGVRKEGDGGVDCTQRHLYRNPVFAFGCDLSIFAQVRAKGVNLDRKSLRERRGEVSSRRIKLGWCKPLSHRPTHVCPTRVSRSENTVVSSSSCLALGGLRDESLNCFNPSSPSTTSPKPKRTTRTSGRWYSARM